MQHATRNRRMHWMDFMRGTAIVLVILYHSSAILELFQEQPPAWLKATNDAFAPYRMPTLMFLSGLLLQRSLAKPLPGYLWGKIRFAGYPFVLWTIVYALTVGIDAAWYSPTFWIASSYLWFLQFVFIFYMIAPALRSIPPVLVVTVPLIGSLFLEDDSVSQRLLFMAAFFFLGDLVGRHQLKLDAFLASRWGWLLLVPAVGFAVASAFSGPLNYFAEFAMFTVAGIGAAMKLAHMVSGASWAKGVNSIGKNSIKYYVVHFPVIYLLMAACLGFRLPIEVVVAVGFVGAMVAGWIAAALSSKTVIRYAFELPAWAPGKSQKPTQARHMRVS